MTEHSKTKGFSLVELLVATLLLSVLFLGAYRFLRQETNRVQTVARSTSDAAALASARVRLEQDFGLAGFFPGMADPPSAVREADSRHIVLRTDADRDGVIEEVTYQISGKALRRTFVEQDPQPVAIETVILEGISDGEIHCLYNDSSGHEVSDCSDPARIRRVRLHWRVPGAGGGGHAQDLVFRLEN